MVLSDPQSEENEYLPILSRLGNILGARGCRIHKKGPCPKALTTWEMVEGRSA